MNLVKKILIVHGDAKARRRLVLLLADAGFDLRAFSTADAAAENARGEWFDLAVVDHELPGSPGLSFVDRLKKIQPTVPVLLLVPELELPAVVQGIRMGVTDVFAACQDPHLLLNRVRALLKLETPVVSDEVTTEDLAEVETLLENLGTPAAASANPFGIHTQEPTAEWVRLTKEKALLEARVERLQHEKAAFEAELKTLLAQGLDERRLEAELSRLQNERELAATAQATIDEKARGLREARAAIASERRALEDERRRLETTALMEPAAGDIAEERAGLAEWRKRLEEQENELAEDAARLRQETMQLTQDRRQWHDDLSLLRVQEDNLRAYEDRLRHMQGRLEADRVLWSGSMVRPSKQAAPVSSGDDSAALQKGWTKLQRAHELLEADRNNFRDDRLALNDHHLALKNREELVRDREIRLALQEKKLRELPLPPPPTTAVSAMKNFTRAPFDMARAVFGSPKKA